ncbi:hypothetical protein ZWY2020_047328 [Hordeum vulgare]|nr:hypothetical protein ZWY2020_047328 [Hordeum vulgare]
MGATTNHAAPISRANLSLVTIIFFSAVCSSDPDLLVDYCVADTRAAAGAHRHSYRCHPPPFYFVPLRQAQRGRREGNSLAAANPAPQRTRSMASTAAVAAQPPPAVGQRWLRPRVSFSLEDAGVRRGTLRSREPAPTEVPPPGCSPCPPCSPPELFSGQASSAPPPSSSERPAALPDLSPAPTTQQPETARWRRRRGRRRPRMRGGGGSGGGA